MEKYGQYRDKGSGIAPFFPISAPATSPLLWPWRVFLFFFRLPFFIFAWFVWLAFVQWLSPGTLLRKANLWCIIGIPGIWWIDIQVDGVRRGSLGKSPSGRFPQGGSIAAASFTSPIDILYLAAILDPIFTQSYPSTPLVRPIGLVEALVACFLPPPALPTDKKTTSTLVPLNVLTARNPSRCIATFPEGTPSNGRSILTLTPALLSASPRTKIYPISLRYTPADIVTPIPGFPALVSFLWVLLSSQTHCIRTRIGSPVQIPPADAAAAKGVSKGGYLDRRKSSAFDDHQVVKEDDDGVTEIEQKVLDMIADALARLGRVKRVGLGVNEKERFVGAWRKGAKARR